MVRKIIGDQRDLGVAARLIGEAIEQPGEAVHAVAPAPLGGPFENSTVVAAHRSDTVHEANLNGNGCSQLRENCCRCVSQRCGFLAFALPAMATATFSVGAPAQAAAPSPVARRRSSRSNAEACSRSAHARSATGGKALTILAIGSSSTEGVGASSQATRPIPPACRRCSSKSWPKHAGNEIVNAGIGGETAPADARAA